MQVKSHQSESGDKKNLARFMVESLENISCYDHFDVMVLTALSLHTNWEKRLVYESRDYLLRFTKMKKSTWADRLRWLEMDGLIKRLISRGELMHQPLQQNYQILLPDRKFFSCEYWPEHYINGSHDQRLNKSKLKRDQEAKKEEEARLQEYLNELHERQVQVELAYAQDLSLIKAEKSALCYSGLMDIDDYLQEFNELPH